MPKKTGDLTGQRFQWLTVIGPERDAQGFRAWRVRCDCGQERVYQYGVLRRHRSCGCWTTSEPRKAEVSAWRTRHAHTKGGVATPTYRVWSNMMQRCFNPANGSYNRYGGRGITVCERWRSFENFLADMGERPDHLTIDRVNNDGNYEPGNVRWATYAMQNRNSTAAKLTVEKVNVVRRRAASGEDRGQIAADFGVTRTTINNIISRRTWYDETR